MAINKNFVVKHGLEVDNQLILANADTNKVGIATSNPAYTLHVNGGIGATDLRVTGVSTIQSLVISGTLNAGGIGVGTTGQYLRSTYTGVEWASFPTLRKSQTFTATEGQTTFSFVHTPNEIDVFVNGVKLSNTEYTDSSIDVTLFNPSFAGDVVELVGFGVIGIGLASTTGISGVTIQDEGTAVGNVDAITSLNFVGATVQAAGTGAGVTITVTPTDLSAYDGNASITGILTVGQSSITLNGPANSIDTGTITTKELKVSGETYSTQDLKKIIDIAVSAGSTQIVVNNANSVLVNDKITVTGILTAVSIVGINTVNVTPYNQTFLTTTVVSSVSSGSSVIGVANTTGVSIGNSLSISGYYNNVPVVGFATNGVLINSGFTTSAIVPTASIVGFSSVVSQRQAVLIGTANTSSSGITSGTSALIQRFTTANSNLNITGIITAGAVGASGTSLHVNGNARITGILTVGTSSITLNGATDTLTVPNLVVTNSTTGVTASGVAITVRDGGGDLGLASVIDFGDNLTVSLASGIATITASGGGGGISTYASTAGIATYATSSGISTYSSIAGIATYAPTAGIATYATTAGVSTSVVGGIGDVTQLNVSGISTFSNNINLTSGDINVPLSSKVVFGDTNQLEIYSATGPAQVVKSTGDLTLRQTTLYVNNAANDENLIVASENGSVDLYYDNSKKFETLGTGVTVTGTTFTNQLSVSGSSTLVGNVGIGTTNPTSALTVKGSTSLETLSVSGVSTFPINVAVGVDFAHQGSLGKFRISGDGFYGNGRIGFYDSSNNLKASWDSSLSTGSIDIYNYINSGTENITISAGSSVVLQHGGTNTKLQTLGAGVTVTGTTFTNQLNVSGVSTFPGGTQVNSNGSILIPDAFAGGGLLKFGDGNDLQIYHNGSNSYIDDAGGTGNLIIRTNRLEVVSAGNENIAQFYENGPVELYYDSSKKFETLGTGVTVTGTTFTNELSVSGVSTFNGRINASSSGILFDTSSYTGSDEPIKLWIGDSGSGRYFTLKRSNGGQVIFDNAYPTTGHNDHRAPTHSFTQTGGDYYALFNSGSVKLYHPASASGILDQKFQTLGAGVTVTGTTFTNQLNVSGVSTFGGTINANNVGAGISVKLSNSVPTYLEMLGVGNYSATIKNIYDSNSSILVHSGAVELRSGGTNNYTVFQGTIDGTGQLMYRSGAKLSSLTDGVQVNGTTFTDQLSVGTGGTTVTTTSAGNVGIGTTNASSKLTVRGGDISVGVSTAHGVILTSPNGTQYRLIVADNGTLSTVAV